MYIKYQSNINNLKNFYTIAKIGETSIHLIMKDGSFSALDFSNVELRDFIVSQIWSNLKSNSKTYDVDEEVFLHNDAKKYNIL